MSDAQNWSGKTVNERLFEVGLIDDFNSAAGAGDRAKMTDILSRVDVPATMAEAILADPSKYGFEK